MTEDGSQERYFDGQKSWRGREFCLACQKSTEIFYVHGHGACNDCGRRFEMLECCTGEIENG